MTGLYRHKMCHKKCFNQVLRDILWRSFRYYVTPKLDNIWHKKSSTEVNNMWRIIWRQTSVTKTILNRARMGRQQHSVMRWPNTMWHKLASQKRTIRDNSVYRHKRYHILWRSTIFSSCGTFSDGRYMTTIVTVTFRHNILFVTNSVVYVTISVCHTNPQIL